MLGFVVGLEADFRLSGELMSVPDILKLQLHQLTSMRR